MAATFTIVTQYPDVETDGGQVARNVMVVGTLTDAHGVYFERRYARKSFTHDLAVSEAGAFSQMFEDIFKIDDVDAVTWGQRLDAANQLQDFVTVYYTSSSGESSNYVEVPFSRFNNQFIAPLVSKGVAQLDALEAA